jgi:hypothetical protein
MNDTHTRTETLINLQHWIKEYNDYYNHTKSQPNLNVDIILKEFATSEISQSINEYLFTWIFQYLTEWITNNTSMISKLFQTYKKQSRYFLLCQDMIKKLIDYVYTNTNTKIQINTISDNNNHNNNNNNYNHKVNILKQKLDYYYDLITDNIEIIAKAIWDVQYFAQSFKVLLQQTGYLTSNKDIQITDLLYKLIRMYIACIGVVLFFNNTNTTHKATINQDLLIFICGSYIFIDNFIDDDFDILDNVSIKCKDISERKLLKYLKMQIIENILNIQFQFLDLLVENNYLETHKNTLDSFYSSWFDKNYISSNKKLLLIYNSKVGDTVRDKVGDDNIRDEIKNSKQSENIKSYLDTFEDKMIIVFNHIFSHLLEFYVNYYNTNTNTNTDELLNSKKYNHISQYNDIIKYCFHIEKECWLKQKGEMVEMDRMKLTIQKGLSTCYLWFYGTLNCEFDDEKVSRADFNYEDRFKIIEWFSIYTQLLDDIHDIKDDYKNGISTSCICHIGDGDVDSNNKKLNKMIITGCIMLLNNLDKYLECLYNRMLECNTIGDKLLYKKSINIFISFVVYTILPHLDIISNSGDDGLISKVGKYLDCCEFNIGYLKRLRNIKNENKDILRKIFILGYRETNLHLQTQDHPERDL